MKNSEFRNVSHSVRKKDALQLLLGKPVYTADVIPDNTLIVKILRSRYANAIVEDIDTEAAYRVEGVVGIYTWKDVPGNRFTIAGQTYPEPSPYDRLIIDRHVRFVGDVVAIVAAETEKAAEKACRLIKVRYQVLEPVFDFHKAKDHETLIHPEEDWTQPDFWHGNRMRNLVASGDTSKGDVERVFSQCDFVLDRTYHTKSFNQAMMETFRAEASIDTYGRLCILSSTQIVFHVRKVVARALGISKNMVRVEKPRVGGGFGAKQTAVCEIYPAFVTWKTGRPSYIEYTRKEAMIAGSPRHEMEIRVRLGADKSGIIKAIDIYSLSNTGAYGEHGPTTVGLTGTKTIPLYTGNLEAYRFGYDVVYTNTIPAGAYRGYGATQGTFALETTVNELAETIGIDPAEIRLKNMVREGMIMTAYENEKANACALERCMQRCKDLFGWDEKCKVRDLGNGKYRSAGVAMAMQGSCISNIDVGSAIVKLNEDGTYQLVIGAADMGTGCDTILAQICAECLECGVENISVFGADTDVSPYDSGSYASSTTYLTGKAAEEACLGLIGKMCRIAAGMLGCSPETVVFENSLLTDTVSRKSVTVADIGIKAQSNECQETVSAATHSSPFSPPPYMVGMCEIELDSKTGEVKVLDYTAVIDCGTVINPSLARIQAEGGLVQGIGHTLMEDISISKDGALRQNSFLQYRIPSRLDIGKLRVEFESSYEPTGPFGAKSIGEIVINTPAPAIIHAIYRATGVWHREIPVHAEDICLTGAQDDRI